MNRKKKEEIYRELKEGKLKPTDFYLKWRKIVRTSHAAAVAERQLRNR